MRAAIIGSLDIECMGGGEANTVMFANILVNVGYNVTYFGSGCAGYGDTSIRPEIKIMFDYRSSSFKHDPMAHPRILKTSRLLSVGLIGMFRFRKTQKMLESFDLYYFANPSVLSRKLIPKILTKGGRVIIANHGTFFEYLGNSTSRIMRIAGRTAGKLLLEPLQRFGNGIVIHTQNSFQTEYYKNMGFDSRNLFEIPQHNIDFTKYAIISKREGFSVAFLGRLTESKGINILINVANMNPDMNFHVIGRGQMTHQIIAGARYKNIVVHGFLSESDKQNILAMCDAMIVPSMFESLSISSIEGLACGLPLVASQSAHGLRYIIQKDTIYGKLLPRDPQSFSNELQRLKRRKENTYNEYVQERESRRASALQKLDEKTILNNLTKLAHCWVNAEECGKENTPEITRNGF